MAELIFNGFLLIFFIAMFFYSTQITIWEGDVWARYWPMMILALAIIIFTIKVAGIVRKLPKEERKFSMDIFGFHEKNVQLLLISFAWAIFYGVILSEAGFIISTIVFATGMQMILGSKLSVKTVITSVVVTIFIYAVFVWGLGVSVPRGAGPLYDFGMWLEYIWS